jgi:hypothetical protein
MESAIKWGRPGCIPEPGRRPPGWKSLERIQLVRFANTHVGCRCRCKNACAEPPCVCTLVASHRKHTFCSLPTTCLTTFLTIYIIACCCNRNQEPLRGFNLSDLIRAADGAENTELESYLPKGVTTGNSSANDTGTFGTPPVNADSTGKASCVGNGGQNVDVKCKWLRRQQPCMPCLQHPHHIMICSSVARKLLK